MPLDSVGVDLLASWRWHPLKFVWEVWDVWPDDWQREVLEAFPHNDRVALLASKGVGKSTTLVWIAWNFLVTRINPKMVAISVSAEQLSASFWSEMRLWYDRSPLLQSQFTFTKTKIFKNGHPETWTLWAKSYAKTANPQEQSATLAGLHSESLCFFLDESGSMPYAILPSAEAALATAKDGHLVQAGNPTRKEGPLWHAASRRHEWFVVEVNGAPDNPRRSPRVSIEWARQQIEQWGPTNPWVLVNVYGQFPRTNLDALIGFDEIVEATRRSYDPSDNENSPKILGVDVALHGDDQSIISPRQGLVAYPFMAYRNINGIIGAGVVARKMEDWGADAVFVDATGGYGSSWIDQLELLGLNPIPVLYSGKSNAESYYNKRAEMHFLLVRWIKDGGQLPGMAVPGMREFAAALSSTTYTAKDDRLILEPKELVKARLGYSPDEVDSLCCTFAQPVAPRGASFKRGLGMRVEYDPFAEIRTDDRPGARDLYGDPYAERSRMDSDAFGARFEAEAVARRYGRR